jgi:hypothetical protein
VRGFRVGQVRKALRSSNEVLDTLFEIWDRKLEKPRADIRSGATLDDSASTLNEPYELNFEKGRKVSTMNEKAFLVTDMYRIAHSLTIDILGHVAFSYDYQSIVHQD